MKTTKKTTAQIRTRKRVDGSLRSRAHDLTTKLGFSVTPSAVRGWIEKGYPIDDPKKLLECLRGQERSPIPVPKTITDAKLKKLLVDIDAAEFRLAVQRGEYTRNDEVREQGAWLANRVRDEMQRFIVEAPTWAGLAPEEIERRAKVIITAISQVFHSLGKERAKRKEGDE